MSDVVTGEAVALDLRIAQLPSRLTAAFLDVVVMVLGYTALLLALLRAGLEDADDALEAAVGVVLLVLVFLGYPVAMETLTRGRSLGKMALGLRVVRDDGGPITFRHALVRGLVGLALERPGVFLATLGPPVGMLVSMFSARGKRIGDMAAGTVVLQERVPERPLWTPVMPYPLARWAPTLDLTRFDDALALQVRQFLDRAGELTPGAREALAAELVAEVRARTTPDPPPGTPGWAYLTALLAERRRREEERALRAAGLPPMPPGWYPGWPVPGYGTPGPSGQPPYAGGPAPSTGGPAPFAGGPAPFAGGPPSAGGPAPFGGGQAPFGGGPAPFAGGPPSAGGPAPFGSGPAPSAGGPQPPPDVAAPPYSPAPPHAAGPAQPPRVGGPAQPPHAAGPPPQVPGPAQPPHPGGPAPGSGQPARTGEPGSDQHTDRQHTDRRSGDSQHSDGDHGGNEYSDSEYSDRPERPPV